MNWKNWTITVFSFLMTASSRAQFQPGQENLPLQFTESRITRGDFADFEVDALDNLYVITRDYQLKKYGPKGDSISVWNDVRAYGNPTMLDVSNPLRILLYYKPFATIVILDRFLAFRHSINLRKAGIFKVNTVVNSYDNNIWLFDEQDLRLKKMDDEGNVLFETTDWRMLFETAPSPFKIIDHENSVYVFDEASGWYVFDYYGSLKKRLSVSGWKIIGKNKDFMYGFSNNLLHTAELPDLKIRDYVMPARINDRDNIRIMNGRAYWLQPDGVHIYKIENRK